MTSSKTAFELAQLLLAQAVATRSTRSFEDQRELLTDLLREAFEARFRRAA